MTFLKIVYSLCIFAAAFIALVFFVSVFLLLKNI